MAILKLKKLKIGKQGFLLLEVMVSVVVITVGLVYIIRSFSVSTRAISTSRNYMQAVHLMEAKLWDLEENRRVETGEDEGYFADNRKFRWAIKAETEEESPLNKINLVVSWKEGGKKQSLTATTYLWNKED